MQGKIRRLSQGCTVLGMFESLPSIKEEIIPIDGPTLILSFTDGLADLKNSKNEYFEDKGIEGFVNTHGELSAQDFNKQLLEEIEKYRGEEDFTDDIAVLTCKIF